MAQQLATEVAAVVKAKAAASPRPRTSAKAVVATAPASAAAAAVAPLVEVTPLPEPAAPIAFMETAASSAETVPIVSPIAAVLANSMAESSLAVIEAITSAAPVALDPVTSIAQLSPREISETSAASLAVLAAALALTELPSPRHLPSGAPTDAAPPPGLVPRGDSRSLRRGELFALVYRVHCFVITRHGKIGQLGHWSAVEYPTPHAASHAYARGCSHWVSEGFSDYRGETR